MALTRVQATGKVFNGTAALSLAVPLATPPTLGNAILVPVTFNGSITAQPTTCTDNYGNVYDRVILRASGGGNYATVFACYKVAATGASFTITVGGVASAGFFVVSAIEVAGGVGGLFVDRTAGSNAASGTAPATTATAALRTTSGGAFAVAVCSAQATQASIIVESVAPAWTQEYEQLTSAPGEADSRVLTGVTGTTQSCSWTFTASTSWAAVVVVFASADDLPVIEARETQAVVETLQHPTPSARVTQAIVETLQHPTPSARVTQCVVETLTWSTVLAGGNLVGQTMPSTVALFPPTVVRSGAPQALTGATCPATSTLFAPTVAFASGVRLTQQAVEIYQAQTARARATQLVVEVYLPLTIPTRITQTTVEIYRGGEPGQVRLSQELVELWIVVPPCTAGSAAFPIDPEPTRGRRRR